MRPPRSRPHDSYATALAAAGRCPQAQTSWPPPARLTLSRSAPRRPGGTGLETEAPPLPGSCCKPGRPVNSNRPPAHPKEERCYPSDVLERSHPAAMILLFRYACRPAHGRRACTTYSSSATRKVCIPGGRRRLYGPSRRDPRTGHPAGRRGFSREGRPRLRRLQGCHRKTAPGLPASNPGIDFILMTKGVPFRLEGCLYR